MTVTGCRPVPAFADRAAWFLAAIPWLAGTAWAGETEQGWTFGGVIAAALQCQDLPGEDSDACRGTMPVQPEVGFRLDDSNVLHAKLGLAAGNGLGPVSPFGIPVWPADLQGDVQHINDGNRSYLLTAWYRHIRPVGGGATLALSGGIIDGTDFLDQNAYANDEFAQFMNGALVNGPNGFVPSYEPGVALEWEGGRWSLSGVYMHAGEGEAGGHDYLGLQAGVKVQTAVGPGTWRLLWQGTSGDFAAAAGDDRVARSSWTLSADQQLGEVIGVWVRAGRQDGAAAIGFRSLYSGGIALRGQRWGRAQDELALGFGFARGGNLDIGESRVIEAYYRVAVSEELALTADVQHLRETYRSGIAAVAGWVAGLRLTLDY